MNKASKKDSEAVDIFGKTWGLLGFLLAPCNVTISFPTWPFNEIGPIKFEQLIPCLIDSQYQFTNNNIYASSCVENFVSDDKKLQE